MGEEVCERASTLFSHVEPKKEVSLAVCARDNLLTWLPHLQVIEYLKNNPEAAKESYSQAQQMMQVCPRYLCELTLI